MKKDEMSLLTKQKLAMSLKKLMKKKAFDKITVSELLKDCDITRPTFYYHFQDIYALMEWMFETEAIELLKRSSDLMTWDDGMLMLSRYVKDNDKVCLCAYNSLGRKTLERIFFQDTKAVMKNFIDILLKEISAKPEHVEFIADFYTMAFVSCLAKWLSDGLKQTPEELIELIDITMHGNIAEALRRSSKIK
jgi:Transcriptional regulator